MLINNTVWKKSCKGVYRNRPRTAPFQCVSVPPFQPLCALSRQVQPREESIALVQSKSTDRRAIMAAVSPPCNLIPIHLWPHLHDFGVGRGCRNDSSRQTVSRQSDSRTFINIVGGGWSELWWWMRFVELDQWSANWRSQSQVSIGGIRCLSGGQNLLFILCKWDIQWLSVQMRRVHCSWIWYIWDSWIWEIQWFRFNGFSNLMT